ncbi:hypothetical protein GX618_02170 [Candidatus Dojkabacteria bacterium]|jgi:hypothetical protein|uniref:Uncharacterized protein n=1 Tax=Candidatus Dojkabacteria bacterium TaxID=2099670 RepID=A0A847ETF0_9BACT|nr:hypothetical protein [Candidatus Dojkabacteria bacterium]HRX43804.1 hypothetical protein [Candidatus Dojkabacteria bacterium]
MDKNARARTTSSTQEHLEIREIVDDIIITQSGSAALVLQTSAINFDLLAEYEQDSKVFAFAGLLNSLNFHIQILIRTRRIDISNYIDYLKNKENDTMTEGLKKQLHIYTEFIQKLIIENDVLDKNFFIVIPFNPGGDIPTAKILKSKKTKEEIQQNLQLKQEQLVEKAKIFLYPKRDHVLKQLSRMGLMGKQLTNKELISEFYTIYNPEEELER